MAQASRPSGDSQARSAPPVGPGQGPDERPAIVLLGGGGHALVVAEAAELAGMVVAGFLDDHAAAPLGAVLLPEPGSGQGEAGSRVRAAGEAGPVAALGLVPPPMHLGRIELGELGLTGVGHRSGMGVGGGAGGGGGGSVVAVGGGFHGTEGAAWCSGLDRVGAQAWIVALGDLRVRRGILRAAALRPRMQGRARTVIHPSAVVSPTATIGPGTYVGPRAIVHARARVGAHAILNSGCIVEHDCVLGENVHIAPGATLGGTVKVGADTLVGLNATVIPGTAIGAGCLIGAGSVVIRGVPDGQRVAGVPASPLTGS